MVPDEQLTEAVTKVAHTIANNAPLSIAASKLFIDQVMRDPSARDVEAVQKAMSVCFNSADYREGRTAFMEKRQPRFQGK
jgi:enoyl-CoA hydratase